MKPTLGRGKRRLNDSSRESEKEPPLHLDWVLSPRREKLGLDQQIISGPLKAAEKEKPEAGLCRLRVVCSGEVT